MALPVSLTSWVRAPTTIGGIATILGTVTAVLNGQLTWQAGIPAFVGGIVAIILPDNSVLSTASSTAAGDLLNLATAVSKAKAATPAPAKPVLMTMEDWQKASAFANADKAPAAAAAAAVAPADPALADRVAKLEALLASVKAAPAVTVLPAAPAKPGP